jgi:hypothetical protein
VTAAAHPALLREFWTPGRPLPLRPDIGPGTGLLFRAGVIGMPGDLPAGVAVAGPGIGRIAFDPEATLARVTAEAYVPPARPLHSRSPVPHRWIPPALKMALLRRALRVPLRRAAFPAWPADGFVEDVRAAIRDAALEAGILRDPAPLWPDGRAWAACLSHDIDSAEAYRRDWWRPFADLEEAHGLRSSWHACTEHLPAARPALLELHRRGHEIAWHGPAHDYRIAWTPPDRIAAAARAFRDLLPDADPRGFRSPNFLRTPALWEGLTGAMGYDSSARDTAAELFARHPRQGCGTVFPFFRGSLLELPITIPDDLSIRCVRPDDAEAIAEIQIGKLAWIRARSGMALALSHPEAWISLTPGSFGAYRKLVAAIAADRTAWTPLPRAVEAWWRARHGVPG